MIPRDYRTTGAALAANINTYVEKHPDSFECLLYRADLTKPETVASNADVVGSMESSERRITYRDPEPARAVQIVDAVPFFPQVTNSGAEADGNREQPIMLILNRDDVPEQSMIQYEELVGQDDERRLVCLYVMHIDSVATAPGAKKRLHCIPNELRSAA